MTVVDVHANLRAVHERIAAAAARAGRDAAEVTLVAVSKGIPAGRIPRDLGVPLGENRVAELREKQAVLGGEADRWHFIGTLQRRKARDVVGRVALIHSVDRLELAEEIDVRARDAGAVQAVLIEVNTSGEPTKHGVPPGAAVSVARAAADLTGLAVRGFMTMAPPNDPAASARCFEALRAVRDEATATLPEATELSMGMTGDVEIAVERGATIVRVGTAIFGPRPP